MSESDVKKFIDNKKWMLKPCHMYQEEYSDCKSIKAKLHQYFIYGETLDCTQWKEDFENCRKWHNNDNHEAAVLLIQSESKRRKERLDAHYGNTTWEKRAEPPKDWAKPLPEWMEKEHALSYLGIKSKEHDDNSVKKDIFENRTFCTIM